MTATTKVARRKPAADTGDPLVTVVVTPGRAVFWDGEQREGTLHDVPKSVALSWLDAKYADAVEDA